MQVADGAAETLRRRAAGEMLRRRQLREECRGDLVAFLRLFWRAVEPAVPLVEGWAMEAICDALMAVSDGHLRRLIINVPPGFSKSLITNVFWPAWEWGPLGRAHERYISSSYSISLTERDNGRMLRLISDPLYRALWPAVRVVKEGVGKIENSLTGWKLATSVGGTMTGQRGSRILIDDPNNPTDTESEAVRGATNLWLREVMPDRLGDLQRDAIVCIQQRVHEEDATGTLVKYGSGYAWLVIPMEYDPLRSASLVLRRDGDGKPADVWLDPRGLDEHGEPLVGLYTDAKGALAVRPGSPLAAADGALAWPERFPESVVEEMRTTKGAYAYSGQYLQLPSARGGGVIRRDWWGIWSSRQYPDFGTVVAALDTAVEEREENDWNALTVWCAFAGEVGQPQVMLADAARWKCKLAELVRNVAEICYKRKVDWLLIEHKTRGRDVHDEIRRLYSNAPWQTVLVKPQGDKVSRLQAVSHLFSGDVRRDPTTGIDVFDNGMIFAPDTVWADEVIDEVTSFPRGSHDDYVDTVSLALGWVRKHGVVLRRSEHDAREEEAKRYRCPAGVPYAIGSQ